VSLNSYHSAWQLRSDGWTNLNDDLTRLVEGEIADVTDTAALRARIAEAMALLQPIESYWAFPGRSCFERLLAMFEKAEFEAVRQLVARISRALTSHSYRHRHIPLTIEEGFDAADEDEELLEEDADHPQRISKPYFEVLVVDQMSEREEATLRAGLKRMQRAEDRFVYEIVVVPSFEDALIAVLINFNVQACIIRHGFPSNWRNCGKASAARCSAPRFPSCGPSSICTWSPTCRSRRSPASSGATFSGSSTRKRTTQS
jgi:arginine decarboxylase